MFQWQKKDIFIQIMAGLSATPIWKIYKANKLISQFDCINEQINKYII